MTRSAPNHMPIAFGAVTVLTLAACQLGGSAATPSPSAASMTIAGMGNLNAVDGEASGIAELVMQPDGSYAVILDQFSIADTKEFTVALAPNQDVTTTADVDPEMILELGRLQGTSGMQSYPVPADMAGGVMDYHSVLIWDGPMGLVIAAAPLAQP